MESAFGVRGNYHLESNAPAVIRDITKQFKLALEAGQKLKTVFAELENSSLSRFIGQLREIDSLGFSGLVTSAEAANRSMSEMENRANALQAALERASAAAGNIRVHGGAGIQPSGTSNGGGVPGSGGGGGSDRHGQSRLSHVYNHTANAYLSVESFKGAAEAIFDPIYDIDNETTRIAAMTNGNWSLAHKVRADAIVQQRSIRGTNAVENMDIWKNIYRTIQNPDEASAIAPALERIGVAIAAMNPAGGTYSQQTETAAQSAEYLGRFINPLNKKFDTERFIRFTTAIMKNQIQSGGKITFKDWSRFFKSSGFSALNLTDEALSSYMPLIQAMGANRAGQTMQSYGAQWLLGNMGDATVDVLLHDGIIGGGLDKKHNRYLTKAGVGNWKVDPRGLHFKNPELMSTNPAKFVNDILMPEVKRSLQAEDRHDSEHLYSRSSPENRNRMEMIELARLATRLPGGVFLLEAYRSSPMAFKDTSAVSQMDADRVKDILANSPSVSVDNFSAAVKGLDITLNGNEFKHLVSALDGFSTGINKLSSLADKHPEIAQKIAPLAVDGGIAAVIAGVEMWFTRKMASGGLTRTALRMLPGAAGDLFAGVTGATATEAVVGLGAAIAGLGTAAIALAPEIAAVGAAMAAAGAAMYGAYKLSKYLDHRNLDQTMEVTNYKGEKYTADLDPSGEFYVRRPVPPISVTLQHTTQLDGQTIHQSTSHYQTNVQNHGNSHDPIASPIMPGVATHH